LDIDFIIKYLPMYGAAALVTLWTSALGIALAIAVGLSAALLIRFRTPVLRQAALCYIELSRNTPLLVQLFFLYFGLSKAGIMLPGVTCAVVGLAFLGGAYMSEAFRAGLDAVDGIQKESALAVGLSEFQCFVWVETPQAFATALPAVCANMIFLVKETSVFSVVAVADLMFVAKDLIGLYYRTGEALVLLVIFYLVILLPISFAAAKLEKKVRHGNLA
jgi:polar amino acid transport system permease protein